MISADVDTSELRRRLLQFSQLAKRDFDDVLRKEAGTITGLLIEQSPPGNPGGGGEKGTSLAARRAGEERLESDIRKIFPTSSARRGLLETWAERGEMLQVGPNSQRVRVNHVALTMSALRRHHELSRSARDGRTRVRKNGMIAVTRKRLLNAYIREKKKQVGFLSSGFKPAAEKFKTAKRNTPAWIRRHTGAKGAGTEQKGQRGITLTIHNREDWFDLKMGRRMNYVVGRRERGVEKAIDSMLERRARRRR